MKNWTCLDDVKNSTKPRVSNKHLETYLRPRHALARPRDKHGMCSLADLNVYRDWNTCDGAVKLQKNVW